MKPPILDRLKRVLEAERPRRFYDDNEIYYFIQNKDVPAVESGEEPSGSFILDNPGEAIIDAFEDYQGVFLWDELGTGAPAQGVDGVFPLEILQNAKTFEKARKIFLDWILKTKSYTPFVVGEDGDFKKMSKTKTRKHKKIKE